MPIEGKAAQLHRAADVARRDVPVCGLTDRLGEARERVHAAGFDQCIVVDEQRVVLGRLRADALESGAETLAETVMEPAPLSIRPDTPLRAAVERLRKRHEEDLLVTTADGVLIGPLYQRDAEPHL